MGILDKWNYDPIDKRGVIKDAINGDKTVKIIYEKWDGETSERILSKLSYNNEFQGDGFFEDHIKGFCHLRNEERTFKIDRIVKVEVL